MEYIETLNEFQQMLAYAGLLIGLSLVVYLSYGLLATVAGVFGHFYEQITDTEDSKLTLFAESFYSGHSMRVPIIKIKKPSFKSPWPVLVFKHVIAPLSISLVLYFITGQVSLSIFTMPILSFLSVVVEVG